MYRHTIKDEIPLWTAFNWSLLAFLSGSVNAGGFLACHRFVTHITGFATHFGIDLVEKKYVEAFGILTVPVFFVAGAMGSALLVERRSQQGQEPRYDAVMGLVTLCMVMVAVGGYFDWFGAFGEVAQVRTDFLFLVVLCGASGLQNAAITSASRGTMRSTHLTGIATDLGIGLVKYYYTPQVDAASRERRLRVQLVRIASTVAFVLGSVAGALLFIWYQYLGFLLPAAIAAHVTRVAWRERTRHGDSGVY
ncbi:MAG: DUF1275 domain-containing protein [Deltaproteobacteria bacterium]|nr:DUF1275 domain-containing protein [Deltaproteobacteria bacterium]